MTPPVPSLHRATVFPLCLAVLLTSCSPSTEEHETIRQTQAVALEGQVDDEALRARIEGILTRFRDQRLLDTDVNAAWQIMHAVICYGEELKIKTPDRGLVGAVDYLFSGGIVNGFDLKYGDPELEATGRPGMRARLEPGSYVGQGHVDQWIAICAMANLPLNTEIQVFESTFTIEDWVRQTQADVPKNLLNEYSWTLIALTHYLPDEPKWQSRVTLPNGQFERYDVSWEMLVKEEMRYELSEAACGGTHRLAGIVRAMRAAKQLRLEENQVWRDAETFVQELIEDAQRNRGPDGQLSAHYFGRSGSTFDLTSQLASSGHTLEFLALALPIERIEEDWVELAAHQLCETLELIEESDLDCGALYHALNGLKVYHNRRWADPAVN